MQLLLESAQDSARVEIQNKLALLLISSDSTEALRHSRKAEALAEKIEDPRGLADTYINYGHIYFYHDRHDWAEHYYQRALRTSEKNGYESGLGKSLQHLGGLYCERGETTEAISHYQRSIEVLKKLKDRRSLSHVYLSLAHIFSLEDRHEEAFEVYKKALILNERMNDKKGLAAIYTNIGELYFERGEYNKSLDHYNKALHIFIEMGDELSAGGIFIRIAENFQARGLTEGALKHALKAKRIGQKHNHPLLIDVYQLLTSLHREMGERDSSLYYLEKTFDASKFHQSDLKVKGILQTAYAVYKQFNEYDKALQYYEQYTFVSDSILQSEMESLIAASRARYESEKKEKEIALLKKANTEQELINKQHAYTRNFLILCTIIFCLVVLILWVRNREKEKANADLEKLVEERTAQLEARNKEKEVMIQEIHHRVKNNLQLISSLMNLQMYYKGEKDIDEILHICQYRIKCMAIIHDRLNLTADAGNLSIKEYFGELSRFIIESYENSRQNLQVNMEVSNIYLSIDQMIPCGLILNELLSNSMKYGFSDTKEGLINITFQRNNGKYDYQISDNGKGFSGELDLDKLSSLGLVLVHELVAQLDGEIKITNNNGVNVAISFPAV